MTDKKQPDALAFCWATELAMTQQPVTLSVTEAREVSAEMQRLHAENTALRQGYAAARLEIESLKAQLADHADELVVAHLDGRMRERSVPAGEYPALPEKSYLGDDVSYGYDSEDMRAYVDADRAMRAAQPAGAQQPAPSAAAHKACKPDMLVNGGALKLALNVLRRAGKHEVADELEATAQPTPAPQADSVLEDSALLKEARDALWQPANVALCERLDEYLDAARKQGANHD